MHVDIWAIGRQKGIYDTTLYILSIFWYQPWVFVCFGFEKQCFQMRACHDSRLQLPVWASFYPQHSSEKSLLWMGSTDPSCSWLTPCGAVPAQKMLDLFICWQSYSEQPWQAVRHINNVFALNLQMNWNLDFRRIGMTWLFWWLAVISYIIEMYRKQSRKKNHFNNCFFND